MGSYFYLHDSTEDYFNQFTLLRQIMLNHHRPYTKTDYGGVM